MSLISSQQIKEVHVNGVDSHYEQMTTALLYKL